jgi:hypothetical protein
MRVEDWFALAVRVIGITVFVPGLGILLDSLLLKLGYFNLPDTYPAYYVIYGAAQVVLGLYLMRGAPFLVDFVYPREDADDVGPQEK